ncbi:MAG: hypothetical protein WDO15_10180 [Bacteroidota bacterium]
MPGAHAFQVYIDSKLVADQYVTRNTSIPKVALDPTDGNNEIIVKYSECGRTVSGPSHHHQGRNKINPERMELRRKQHPVSKIL